MRMFMLGFCMWDRLLYVNTFSFQNVRSVLLAGIRHGGPPFPHQSRHFASAFTLLFFLQLLAFIWQAERHNTSPQCFFCRGCSPSRDRTIHCGTLAPTLVSRIYGPTVAQDITRWNGSKRTMRIVRQLESSTALFATHQVGVIGTRFSTGESLVLAYQVRRCIYIPVLTVNNIYSTIQRNERIYLTKNNTSESSPAFARWVAHSRNSSSTSTTVVVAPVAVRLCIFTGCCC